MPRGDDEIPVYTPELPPYKPPKVGAWVIAAGILVIVVLFLLFLSVYTVDLGYAAVTVDPFTSKISEVPVIGPRIAIKAPWQQVKKVYIATDAIHMWTDINAAKLGLGSVVGEYPAIEALTQDGLQAWVDLTVRWHILPSSVPQIVKSYPALDFEEKLIIPEIRKITRDIVAEYKAAIIPEKRTEISMRILDQLRQILSKDPSSGGGIIIDDVYVRNIKLPDKFLQAIQDKLTSQQRMIAAFYERNRTIVLANASAMAKILEARGEAESRIIIANGTAESIKLLIKAGGKPEDIIPLIIYLQGLKEVASSNATIILTTGGQQVPVLIPTGGKG